MTLSRCSWSVERTSTRRRCKAKRRCIKVSCFVIVEPRCLIRFFFFFCAYSRTVRAAASRGSDFVIRKLMHGGADLNCRTTDERQWSPLHFAVFGDFPGTIKLLCGERCLCVTARARVITNHLFAILFARRTWRQCQHQRSA